MAVLPACSKEPPPPDVLGSPPVEPRFERRLPRYLAGLEEQVTIVKSELSIHVERADGSRHDLVEVEREDAKAWRDRHGAAGPALVHRLAAAQPTDWIPFAITFDSLEGREDLWLRLQSDDEEIAAAAREEHAQLIAERGAPLAGVIGEHGATFTGAARYAPFVFGEGPPQAVEALAHAGSVRAVLHGGGGEAVDHASSPATVHAVNQFGSSTTGGNRKVGIIEPGTCRVRHTNYLVAAPVTYQDTGAGLCSSSSACDAACGAGSISMPNACAAGYCRDGHGTAVASVIGQMMPDVSLYYANGVFHPCTLQTQAAAFDFFLANGVKIVNQSFGCKRNEFADEGAILDYHARVHGVFVTKSAGNTDADSASDDLHETTCFGTKNSTCVGATTSTKQKRACYSSWKNPGWLGSSLEDREEPDVVAFGGESPAITHHECDGVPVDNVQLAGATTDVAVVGSTGTSFAAPAVAALAALLQEYCLERPVRKAAPDALLLRSWIRTAAFAANPVGWNYSTLQHVFAQGDTDREGRDHEDGGGFAAATTLKKLCDASPKDERVIQGGGLRASTQGQPASGSPDADPAFPEVPPGEQSLKAPLDQTLVPAPGMSGYMFDTLATEVLATGDRFRFTFSWNYCNVASGTGVGPTPSLVDFDIFLYNATRGEGLYASQTGDDVNEGFDVVIPEGWAGTYQVLLYWPTSATFCNGGEDTAWTGWIQEAP